MTRVERAGASRGIAKWSVALVFFVALTALLASMQLYQVTAAGPAKATLRRSVAALSEIDPLLDRNYDALRTQASSAAPGNTVRLRDFPIDVPLTRDEVLTSSKQQLRDLLLNRAADAMYAHGSGVLRESDVRTQSVGAFSVGGITTDGLGFLRSRNHSALGVATLVLAALCVMLATGLALLCRGFGRLGSIGAVVLAAGAPMLLAGIGARFYMRIVSGSQTEYLQHAFLSIGQALAWIPIRDGLAFTALGAALVGLGVAGALWADRAEAQSPPFSLRSPGR
ncbi:MAG TPA: hypothetical protein VEZ14_09995 [Dehalococcoidia bacterium]|nr:hypothetical protein [Dehalococcoidia bacterium]